MLQYAFLLHDSKYVFASLRGTSDFRNPIKDSINKCKVRLKCVYKDLFEINSCAIFTNMKYIYGVSIFLQRHKQSFHSQEAAMCLLNGLYYASDPHYEDESRMLPASAKSLPTL